MSLENEQTRHVLLGMMQIPATPLVLVDLILRREPRINIDALRVDLYLDDTQPDSRMQLRHSRPCDMT